MLKHASNASSATASASASAPASTTALLPVPPVTVALPLNGQLLRTASVCANSSTSSSNNNNNNNNGNGSSGSGNNTPSVPVGVAAATAAAAAAGAGGTATTTTNSSVSASAAAGAGSPTPAAAALASTARNIHLRPPQPQPLNISALNASTCSTLLNGGCRVANTASNLLNIAMPTTPTPLKPLTPLTPLTPNGHCNSNGSLHHHTYTNQHILASSHQQQQQQQQQQTLPLPAQPKLSHSLMQPQSPPPQHLSQLQQHNYSNCNNLTGNGPPMLQKLSKPGPSPREALTSLGLLCLSSLLLALLSLIFLLKISPNGREDALSRGVSSEDFIIVYDVTLALCALSLSLNLCCLLVCAIQFLFAVKLRSPAFEGRDNKYLKKSSASRTCAVSGFFISIPVFLTGIILYTFNHFHSTPAIITSVLIGVGIVFCGGAMVHNVFVWQKEKTISYRSAPLHGTLVGSLPHNMSLLSAAPLPLPLPLPLPPPQMQLYQGHHACVLQPTSVTPVSPNHSHGSFNPLLCNNIMGGGGGGAINSSFLVRPSTATPPTPKPLGGGAGSCLVGREASGSVSPGIPPTLDMSNITISLHELSTLV